MFVIRSTWSQYSNIICYKKAPEVNSEETNISFSMQTLVFGLGLTDSTLNWTHDFPWDVSQDLQYHSSFLTKSLSIWFGYVPNPLGRESRTSFCTYIRFILYTVIFWSHTSETLNTLSERDKKYLVHFCSILIVSNTVWPLIYSKISSWELTVCNICRIADYGRNTKQCSL